MKSKNKFTNNFNLLSRIKNASTNSKSTTYISAAIITLILGFSIYILYFNSTIFVQTKIVNSLNEKDNTNHNSEDYLVENFDVSKYVDVCKNRNTHFYSLSSVPADPYDTDEETSEGVGITKYNNKTIDECEKLCDISNCHAFTFKDNICYNYKGTLNPTTNIDTRNATTNPIKINCNTKILAADKYNAGVYNGVGFLNKNYFQYNKSDISYIDPYLEETTNILGDLYSIENKRNQIRNLDPLSSSYDASYHALSLATINQDKALFRKFDTLNQDLFDIPADSSRNVLYTDMYNNSTIANTILAPRPRDAAFVEDITKKNNMVKKSDTLDGTMEARTDNFTVNNIQYLILTLIMVVTIIMLVLYKSSNVINEQILIVYIISVTFLVLFITHQLKF